MNTRNGLTFRSVLIAIALMVAMGVWIQYAEFYTKVTGVSDGSGVFVAFMLVLLLGHYTVRNWRWARLDRSEVLVVYSMLMVGVPVMAFGVMHFLLPVLTGESYAAHIDNSKYHREIIKTLPSWFAVTDADAVKTFWRGAEGTPVPEGLLARIGFYLRGGVPWEHWYRPMLLAWLPLLTSLFVAMLCVAAFLRKQWEEAERLPFPQTAMPLAILDAGPANRGRLWDGYIRNKIFWIGVAVPVLLSGVNGLHHYYPAIPEIRTTLRLSEIITEKPWSAMTLYSNFSVSPLLVGLACLITFEVGFSFVFFYMVTRLELLWAELLGLSGFKGKSQFWATGTLPFFEEQSIGAAVSFAVVALWMARRHLGAKVRSIRAPAAGEDDEPVSSLGALTGIGVSAAVFVVILAFARMNAFLAAFVFAMYLCIAICIAKVRAEAAVPIGLGSAPYTDSIFFVFGGTTMIGISSLSVFNHFYLMCPGVMLVLMAVQMESFRMCEATGLRRKAMTKALVIAFVAAFVIGTYTTLTICYRYGMDKMTSYPCFAGKFAVSQLGYDMQTPVGTDWVKIGAMGFGAVIVAVLTFLRYTVMSWPLHPAGYFMSVSRASSFWSSALIALAIKWALLKWGGLRTWEKAYPAFIGLIFGDLAMRAFWALIATIGLLKQGQAGFMG